MKKIMPTILAAVLMISTVSLLVGCGGIEEDPDAVKTNTEDEGTEDNGSDGDPATGIDGVDGINPTGGDKDE